MTDTEIAFRIARGVMEWKAIGVTGTSPGLFWDNEVKRTRLIVGSAMHDARKKLGITDEESDGFLFNPARIMDHAYQAAEKCGAIAIQQTRLETPSDEKGWSASVAGCNAMWDPKLSRAICLAIIAWLDRGVEASQSMAD